METRMKRSFVSASRLSGTLNILPTLSEQITSGINSTIPITIFAIVTEEK
jgi:hypothetical protein